MPTYPEQDEPAAPDSSSLDVSLGQVTTFYSYKGGTGRTMALANVAWILAAAGKRVLILDWDLEAPGVHRYFAPLLADPELAQSEGLIDWLYAYLLAATRPPPLEQSEEKPLNVGGTSSEQLPLDTGWVEPYLDLTAYTAPVEFAFPGGGGIDIVGAGRQNATYGARVNTFDWINFYKRFYGAAFLSRAIASARKDYDHVLIDSRTGVSDTSGICTVQLPDALVVFFTLNRQSILGVTGILQDVVRQRQAALLDGTQPSKRGIQIWPVPTRVEVGEQKKLNKMRLLARRQLTPILEKVDKVRDWTSALLQAETPYVPFYAYEEVLATVGDEPGATNSLLAACERITANLTANQVSSLPAVSPALRRELLARWEGPELAEPGEQRPVPRSEAYDVMILASAQPQAGVAADALFAELKGRCRVFYAKRSLRPGDAWADVTAEALAGARAVVVALGEDGLDSLTREAEELEKRLVDQPQLLVIPVLSTVKTALPKILASRQAIDASGELGRAVESVVLALDDLGTRDKGTSAPLQPGNQLGTKARPSAWARPAAIAVLASTVTAIIGATYLASARVRLAWGLLDAAVSEKALVAKERDDARKAAGEAELQREEAAKGLVKCNKDFATANDAALLSQQELLLLRSQASGPAMACVSKLEATKVQLSDAKGSAATANAALSAQKRTLEDQRLQVADLRAQVAELRARERGDCATKLEKCEKLLGLR
jgi:MinD-like ATPase involved in chromosome partitioning or flagellar assembly